MKKIVDYISASQLGTYLDCPLKYKYIYVDGCERMPANIYMVHGTAMHFALECNFKQKIKTEKDLHFRKLLDRYKESFDKECTKADVHDPTIQEGMWLSAEILLEWYVKNIAHNYQPLLVEEKFELPLKNYDLTLLGYWDLVTVCGKVIDYKTCGKSWRSQYTQKKVDDAIQGTIYSAAYRKKFGKVESGIEYHIFPRGDNEVHRRATMRTHEDIIEALNLGQALEETVEMGVFPPVRSSCPQCDFKHTCDKLPYIDKV